MPRDKYLTIMPPALLLRLNVIFLSMRLLREQDLQLETQGPVGAVGRMGNLIKGLLEKIRISFAAR